MSTILGGVFLLLVVVGIALGVRALASRRGGREGSGHDFLPYALLAVAVGITVYSIAQLGRAAFPGANIVGSGGQQVASALAGLLVGAPFAVILWRRQAERRKLFPGSSGWPLYLAVAEAVLTTTLVVVTVQLLNWLIGDGDRSSWTDVIVLGAVVGFHEWASREDPPGSEAAGLPRVVGSAIGLITVSIGVAGVVWSLLDYLYGTLFATAGSLDTIRWLILVIIGLPLWVYRWLRPWATEPFAPRKVWLVVTSVAGLATAIGSAVAVAITVVTYVVGDVAAAQHFEVLPGAIAAGSVGYLIWAHHRRRMGVRWTVMVHGEADTVGLRDHVVAAYQYIMAALGMSFAVGSITALAAVAIDRDIVGSDRPAATVSLAIVAIASVAVWWWFWSECQSQERAIESTIQPRRVYLIGMAIVAGVAATQALIAALVVIFQYILGLDPNQTTLVTEGTLAILATGATLHLLQVNKADRALHESGVVILPFEVTIVCSHPGRLAALFPKEAKTKVIYRDDDLGVVTDELAEEIILAVGTKSSIVWVHENGFEVAPAR